MGKKKKAENNKAGKGKQKTENIKIVALTERMADEWIRLAEEINAD